MFAKASCVTHLSRQGLVYKNRNLNRLINPLASWSEIWLILGHLSCQWVKQVPYIQTVSVCEKNILFTRTTLYHRTAMLSLTRCSQHWDATCCHGNRVIPTLSFSACMSLKTNFLKTPFFYCWRMISRQTCWNFWQNKHHNWTI